MKEQSHKQEMSAALRGDFQRLRERGVPVTLVPQDVTREGRPEREVVPDAPQEPAAPHPEPDAVPETAAAAPSAPPEHVEETLDAAAREAGDDMSAGGPDEADDAGPTVARRGWLARFVGR